MFAIPEIALFATPEVALFGVCVLSKGRFDAVSSGTFAIMEAF
jgi:hypothetical protein